MTLTLKEYRDYHRIEQPERSPERRATERELGQFYTELMALQSERVRFLYKQRWEKCRLEHDGLPSKLDVQYLEATLRALKDISDGAKIDQ
jgi:hypothetical protein